MPHPPTATVSPALRTVLAWTWAGVANQVPPAWPQSVDPARVAALAAYHGLEPLLHRAATRQATLAVAVPASLRVRWQQAARVAAAHALLCSGELAALLDLLAAHGIPAMPYKGVALGAHLYGDAAVRANGDIDIIVPAAHAAAAVDALRTERGYTPVYAFRSPRQEAQYVRAGHHYGLRHPGQGFVVELHWDAAAPGSGFAPNWAGIWARSTRSAWQGAPACGPTCEDLLLLLALHGSKHQWARLKWLVDVAALVHPTPELDWPTVDARAGQWRVAQALSLTRTLLADLMGMETGLPARSPLAPAVMRRVESLHEPGVAANIGALLRLHDRRRDRVRYAAHLLLSPNFQDVDGRTPWLVAALWQRPRRVLGKHGLPLVGQLTLEILRGTRGP
jgi:hypothetical protein